jgi:WD40 repeat protein
MGVVYQAQDLRLHRLVALKVVRGSEVAPGDLERFLGEARTLAGLSHPHVVAIHAVSEPGQAPFFTMEWMGGGSLAQKLDGTPWPDARASALVETLARAVHAVHGRHIVHRDLKPANVLLAEDGTPKVADFGLARRLDRDGSLNPSGAIVGTPSYMAPEQALGKLAGEVGPAADVYGLGAILYELLTGRPPFRAAAVVDTLVQVLQEEPVPPGRLNLRVAKDLEAVCLKCLEKNPRRRYASAEALAEDLRRFRDGAPTLARPLGRAGRLWRWARRRPLVASLAALVFVLLAVGAVGGVTAALLINASRKQEVEARRRADRLAEQEARARRQADRLLVVRTFDRALELCRQGKVRQGMIWLAEALERAPPDEQDFRHAIRVNLAAWRLQLRSPRAILSHQSEVRALAVSPVDARVVTATADQKAWVWDGLTGQPTRAPLPHPARVNAVVFRPDGRAVLTGCADGRARLWQLGPGGPAGKPLEVRHGAAVRAVAFRPDGHAFLTGGDDGGACLWDAATGKAIWKSKAHKAAVRAVAFSPDGRAVLTGSTAGSARLWRLGPRGPVGRPLELRHGNGEPATVQAVAFSPDGLAVLTGSRDRSARLWDSLTGKPVGPVLRHPAAVWSVAFRPDGRKILTGGFRAAWVWDRATGQADGPPLAHADRVAAVAYSRDGRLLLTGCRDGSARVWAAPLGRPLGLPLPGPFLPRGQPAETGVVVFSPDGRFVFTGDRGGTARLWQTATGTLIGEWEAHKKPQAAVRAAAFRPDGRALVTGGLDRTARLWRVGSRGLAGRPLELRHRAGVQAVAFRPDGKAVLTGDDTGTARLWDAATGATLWERRAHRGAIRAVAFSPDGATVLTGSADWTARQRRAADGSPRAGPLRTRGVVRAATFAPGGKTVVTGSSDGTAQLWEVSTAARVGSALTHQGTLPIRGAAPVSTDTPSDRPALASGAVVAVAFSPDGRYILTGSHDHTACLWDAATGKAVGPPFRHRDRVEAVAFWADGKSVATVSRAGTAQLWHVPGELTARPALITRWVQVITGLELSHETGGVWRLDDREWKGRAREFQARARRGEFPDQASPSRALLRAWHNKEARESEMAGQWYAALWHLKTLVRWEPGNREFRGRRARALLGYGIQLCRARHYAAAARLLALLVNGPGK